MSEPNKKAYPAPDGMLIPMGEYKRMVTAELLLRVMLAADTGDYGIDNRTVQAVRRVCKELKMENGNAE